MTRQGQIAQMIQSKRGLLATIKTELAALQKRHEDGVAQVRDDSSIEDIDTVETELDVIAADVKKKQEETATLEGEIEDLEKELNEAQEGMLPPEGEEGTRNMKELLKQQRDAFNAYIRSRGAEKRDGFVSEDGFAIIPVDVSYAPTDEIVDEYDLSNLVNIVPVTTATGTRPIQTHTDAIYATVEELAANPKLSKPLFEPVDYKISTYRGDLGVSQESIDDAAVDLVALIQRHIKQIEINTKNQHILAALKTFDSITVSSVDEIKRVVNVTLKTAYKKTFIVTKSFYNAVDTLKDKNGRYLFQESITSPSGFSFLGKTVYIVEDTHLGEEGDLLAWVGDSKLAVTLFDRAVIAARWVDNGVYGQYLMGGLRMQVKSILKDAGRLLNAAALVVAVEEEEDGEGA